MSAAPRPLGVAFDYGNTLVRIQRPRAALEAAGDALEPLLPDAGNWRGQGGALAVALDAEVDRLADLAHAQDPEREVDAVALYRRALTGLLGFEPAPELVRAGLVATQRAWAEGGVHPDPEAVEVLEELSRQGLRLGLCSNALYPPDLMREQLVRLGLARFFDATLFTSEIGWRKPSERVFRELLVRLELPAREVWFVGDDWEADILGARRAGLTPILAPGGSSRDAATTVLAEWAELPRLLT